GGNDHARDDDLDRSTAGAGPHGGRAAQPASVRRRERSPDRRHGHGRARARARRLAGRHDRRQPRSLRAARERHDRRRPGTRAVGLGHDAERPRPPAVAARHDAERPRAAPGPAQHGHRAAAGPRFQRRHRLSAAPSGARPPSASHLNDALAILRSIHPGDGAVAAAVVGLAAVLRGFTSFGLALAAVPGLTLVLPPAEAVPCVLLLQIAAGAQLVPGTRNAIDWGALAPILIGAIAATPIGTVLLAGVPADAMRAAIGLVLLAAVVLLTRRPLVARRPSLASRGAIGVMSGVLNGSTAMAGPPVIAYFLAASASHAAGRASLL